ncbi:MAG: hypothetical protein KGH76_05820 [Thaumarchaeota archaeon]|nr:hypothetical protein [Nitrososphaerota archaeon]
MPDTIRLDAQVTKSHHLQAIKIRKERYFTYNLDVAALVTLQIRYILLGDALAVLIDSDRLATSVLTHII